MRLSTTFLTTAIVAGSLLAATAASANTIVGSIWENQPVAAGNAIPSNVPTTTADVTFSAPDPLNFASGGLYTIGEFLASGGGSTILTGASHLGDTLKSTIFDFKGFVTVANGDVFTSGHDDGLTLIIGGTTVLSAPGPTGFATTSSTYTGPTATLAFELVYGECCGAPANLSISLPFVSPVPEPATLALLGASLTGLGLIRRRRA